MAEGTFHYSRRKPADRGLRASNVDRDAVAGILRREHAAGRLDTDEFGERFGRCLEAKTYAQLDELIADLPADPEPAFAPASAPPQGGAWGPGPRWAGRRRWRPPVLAWLVLAVAIVAVGHWAWWLAFPLLFFFVVRPLVWRSAWRSGWGGPGWGRCCWGPGARRGWYTGPDTTV